MKLMPLRYAGNCTTCGVHVQVGVPAWYDPVTKVTCTGCRPVGTQLATDIATASRSPGSPPMHSARSDKDKGNELERNVAGVFAAHGYRVQTNITREGRSGVAHEVDVLAEKSDDLLTLSVAIECKAWAKPIEKDVVAKFNEVRRDLGLGHAVIVSLNGARPGAMALAAELGVILWGQDEIARHAGASWVLNLQNRPMVQEVGFPRVLATADAERLVAKETGGRLGLGKEELVWEGNAWIPVAAVQLTLRKYGPFQRKMATTQAWGVYDLVEGAFVTRVDIEPERTPVRLDGPKLNQILKLNEPAKTLEGVIAKWGKVTSESATQKYRYEMSHLGVPEMHTATVGTSTPFLYPVHLAVARRNGAERIVAVDGFLGRLDDDLGRALSRQIASVRSVLGV